jgi:hypothetical protein
MKIIRTFWGDVNSMGNRYTDQITEAIGDNLNEIVYIWGIDNFNYISNLGFDCKLVSDEPYDYSIASNHTLWDYRSLIHKLKCIDMAVKDYGEIVFVDWDCRKLKDLDSEFYEILSNGNELQVPLYAYPKPALKWLIDKTKNDSTNGFFVKLNEFIQLYSYEFENNYIIPNTGFVYCRNGDITEKLLELCDIYKLESVPDEFAVMVYSKELGFSLNEYILNIEPNVIIGKQHQEEFWIKEQNTFDEYISCMINKNIYFKHN